MAQVWVFVLCMWIGAWIGPMPPLRAASNDLITVPSLLLCGDTEELLDALREKQTHYAAVLPLSRLPDSCIETRNVTYRIFGDEGYACVLGIRYGVLTLLIEEHHMLGFGQKALRYAAARMGYCA